MTISQKSSRWREKELWNGGAKKRKRKGSKLNM